MPGYIVTSGKKRVAKAIIIAVHVRRCGIQEIAEESRCHEHDTHCPAGRERKEEVSRQSREERLFRKENGLHGEYISEVVNN